jgi:hypothetical protein
MVGMASLGQISATRRFLSESKNGVVWDGDEYLEGGCIKTTRLVTNQTLQTC